MGLLRRSGSTRSGSASGAAESVAARTPLTPAQAKRMIGVGKAVAPLLAPYALAAAGVARSRWDSYRAGRLGVDPAQLGAYAGRGGALHARISRVAEALNELEAGVGTSDRTPTDASRAFVGATRPRLEDLALAIRSAALMPSARRRTAHKAVAGELDRVELDLLGHLGVTP